MKLISTKLPGVLLLEPSTHADHRGYFCEAYNRKTFEGLGLKFDLLQDNQALSNLSGTIRGLHYQLNPMAQTKIVRVLSGAIYDVVLDLRRESPTFGQWQGFNLSADNRLQLVVPRGFAHGLCTLVDQTIVFYKVDNYFSAEHDRGILWNDPALQIPWPTQRPIMSEKDKLWPLFAAAETNF